MRSPFHVISSSTSSCGYRVTRACPSLRKPQPHRAGPKAELLVKNAKGNVERTRSALTSPKTPSPAGQPALVPCSPRTRQGLQQHVQLHGELLRAEKQEKVAVF